MKDKIWYEKYQPKDLNEYVFSNQESEKLFNAFVDNKEIPHLLISGTQGTGKTSMVHILINELGIAKFDTKIINASSETGVANIRDKVEAFCKTLGTSPFKIVVFEEAEGLSDQAQKALRSLIDSSSDGVRFIFTSNYPDKIIPALHSRLQHVHITELDYDSVTGVIAEILDNEGIDLYQIEDMYSHIDAYIPDMRKIINSIQQHSTSGTLKPLGDTISGSDGFDAWEDMWSKGTPDKDDLLDVIPQLDLSSPEQYYRVMYESIIKADKKLDEAAIVTIADHLYKSNFVADQEINLMSCVILIYSE